MYMMIVAKRSKQLTFEVPVLPGSLNKYVLQRRGLDQGLLFNDPAFELNEVWSYFLRYHFTE